MLRKTLCKDVKVPASLKYKIVRES